VLIDYNEHYVKFAKLGDKRAWPILCDLLLIFGPISP